MLARRADLDAPVNPATIRALRERIDLLEEENRQLREAAEGLAIFPSSWRLAKSEARFLMALVRSPSGCMTHEALLIALYGPSPEVGIDMVRIWASKVRAKLRAAGVAAGVRTLWGMGYGLSAEARTTLQSALKVGEVA